MKAKKVKVLILGATGMLGNTLFRLFSADADLITFATVRGAHPPHKLPASLHSNILCNVNVESFDDLVHVLARNRPDVVINCIGIIKQLPTANDPRVSIPINSILPHRLADLCALIGARLVHISTDCVFSGSKGSYTEDDFADAYDLYGRTKYLGETNSENAITLRTSIIGHELESSNGLVGWFLSQTGTVAGYTRAIFSGLPTVELGNVIRDHVIPSPELHGVYHVSAAPISKYELLKLISVVYGVTTRIVVDDKVVIDRSLDSSQFRSVTNYIAPAWPELVQRMRTFG